MNINEAAKRCGVSDKTIRRAIKQKKLHASYPQPNRAEIAESELERYMSRQKSTYVMSGQVSSQAPGQESMYEQRIAELESRVRLLEDQVSTLIEVALKPPRKQKTSGRLPAQLVSLTEFANLHQVSSTDIARAMHMNVIKPMYGSWTDKSGKEIKTALDAKGRRAFYETFAHSVPMWEDCKSCPHTV